MMRINELNGVKSYKIGEKEKIESKRNCGKLSKNL